MKKITYVVGIAASLWVAYVLNRVGGFLLFFGLARHPVYLAQFLAAFIVSLACPFLFIRAWRGKLSNRVKWIGAVASFLGFLYMVRFRISMEIATATVSFLLVSFCLVSSDTRDNEKGLSTPGRIVFWIQLVTLLVFAIVFLPAVWRRDTENAQMQSTRFRQGTEATSQRRNLSRTPDSFRNLIHGVTTGTDVYEFDDSDLVLEWLVEPRFANANNFYKDVAWVQEEERGPWKLIDKTGRVIVDNFQARIVYSYSDELAMFRSQDGPSGFTHLSGYGFVDLSGNVPIPAQYVRAHHFRHNAVAVSIYERSEETLRLISKAGIIDRDGKTILPLIYDMGIPLTKVR